MLFTFFLLFNTIYYINPLGYLLKFDKSTHLTTICNTLTFIIFILNRIGT